MTPSDSAKTCLIFVTSPPENYYLEELKLKNPHLAKNLTLLYLIDMICEELDLSFDYDKSKPLPLQNVQLENGLEQLKEELRKKIT